MTTLPAPTGSPSFLAARRIAVEEEALPFELALPLARLAYEFGGGPAVVPTKGVLTKKQAQELTTAGYLEMVGDADSDRPVLRRLLQGNQLELPFDVDVASSLDLRPVALVSKHTWAAEVTEAGFRLVFGERRPVPIVQDEPLDDDDDDEDENPDAGRDPGPQADCLGDLEDIAREVVRTWVDSSEFEFVEWAWWELGKRGLTAGDETDGVQWAVLVARVAVLGALLVEFAAHAQGEGGSGNWQYEIWDLVGDYPRAGSVEVGRAAERIGVHAETGDPWESPHDVMKALISREWETVTRALLDEAGENLVFAGLRCASSSDVVYPLAGERYSDAVNEVDGDRLAGYEWVTSGMPSY